jgi:tetratricopeptide (TPR) repeat protein
MNDVGLKSETVIKMLTPQIDVDTNVYWGLGFGLEHTENGDAFWQWGDYGIFRNYIVAYKKPKIGIVYLTNSFNGLSLGQEIVRHAIGGGKDLGLAWLNYAHYDSPTMIFVRTLQKKGIEEATKMFFELRITHPNEMSESSINDLGYTFLNAQRFSEAIEIFKLNVESFPGSANVYDSLAEAFMRNKDYEMAIKYYKKTLEMIPKDKAADKEFLENLKKGALDNLNKLEARLEKEFP